MNEIELLRQTFTYFAKFPLLAGVLKTFNKSPENSEFTDYNTFRTTIETLSDNSLLPGIVDYVFGVDEDIVKKRIEEVTGIYLFVDYGNIITDRDPVHKSESGEFLIAVTVARPVKPQALDMAETILLGDQMLSYISTIKDQIREDSKCHPFLKEITFPVEITPWFARELFNSTGWTMLFKKKGVKII